MVAIPQRFNNHSLGIIYLLGIAVAFFLAPVFSFADVVISEIMYNPKDTDNKAGGEWIEIHSTDSAPVDLTQWIFFENDTNHGIVADGASEVPVGGYAIISNNLTVFKNFFTNYSGLLFKASFSLNDGETLALKNGKGASTTNSVIYKSGWGGKNDGNSLQLSPSGWIAGVPTPGAQNVLAVFKPPPVTQVSNSESSNTSNNSPKVDAKKSVLADKVAVPTTKKSPTTEIEQQVDQSEVASSSTVIYAASVGDSGGYADWVFALIGLIGVGVAGMIFSRGKNAAGTEGVATAVNSNGQTAEKPLNADDFEIIEEKEEK